MAEMTGSPDRVSTGHLDVLRPASASLDELDGSIRPTHKRPEGGFDTPLRQDRRVDVTRDLARHVEHVDQAFLEPGGLCMGILRLSWPHPFDAANVGCEGNKWPAGRFAGLRDPVHGSLDDGWAGGVNR